MASSETAKRLARNIGQLCGARGMSFSALAVAMNWSCNSLDELEAIAFDLTLDDIDRLCVLLGVEPAEIFPA
jgi:transcriptional regulator with XRE-family HTH domain